MIVYRERVLPNVGVIALPILLFPSVWAIMLPLNAVFAFPVALALTLVFAVFIFVSSPVIEISNQTLSARGAKIPLRNLGVVEIIPKSNSFEELGPKLDARAWLSVQASVKTMVKIEILDKQDPTPYWLLSTRKPEELKKALGVN